jgi:aarF domain-containing kinase
MYWNMQVDLLLEARTLWRFGKNFSRDKDVTLPVPLYPWVSQDVLMQTFEEGMHISTYMQLDKNAARRAAVADVGCQCMLDMMLVHNLIHSDLHPGNILVRWCLPDGWLISMAAQALQYLPVDTAKVSCPAQRTLRISVVERVCFFNSVMFCPAV